MNKAPASFKNSFEGVSQEGPLVPIERSSVVVKRSLVRVV